LRLVKNEVCAGEGIGNKPYYEQRHEKDDEPKLIAF
jgi:hypothetical protein